MLLVFNCSLDDLNVCLVALPEQSFVSEVKIFNFTFKADNPMKAN